jgi:hypothetical protein
MIWICTNLTKYRTKPRSKCAYTVFSMAARIYCPECRRCLVCCYEDRNRCKRWPGQHNVDTHKCFEFGQTSEQEGMFGCMRTPICRMYHHITPETATDYVSEFCVRFSTPELFESLHKYLDRTLIFVLRG